MSRKDYIELANVIAGCKLPGYGKAAEAANATRRTIARELASICKRDNPTFDRERFLDACNMTD